MTLFRCTPDDENVFLGFVGFISVVSFKGSVIFFGNVSNYSFFLVYKRTKGTSKGSLSIFILVYVIKQYGLSVYEINFFLSLISFRLCFFLSCCCYTKDLNKTYMSTWQPGAVHLCTILPTLGEISGQRSCC